jgi:hypothetical protein
MMDESRRRLDTLSTDRVKGPGSEGSQSQPGSLTGNGGTGMNVAEMFGLYKATKCRCGKKKRANTSFCGGCYRRLSPRMRSRLYQLFGRGYEEAYEQACDYLDAISDDNLASRDDGGAGSDA